MRGSSGKGVGMFCLFVIVGALLGGILGEVITNWSLGGITPYLIKTFSILDVPPVAINLFVVKFVVGFSLQPNLISILGIIIAAVLFRRF